MPTGRERTGERRPAATAIVRDPGLLGGTPVLRGTRVPVAVPFENPADGLTVDEVLASHRPLRPQGTLGGHPAT